MPIFKGSRYRLVDKLQIEDNDGEINSVFTLRKFPLEVPKGSVPYTTRAGDTFESLAAKHYSDANKWYIIADVNPQVFWPLDLTSNTLIYIPPRTYAVIS